MYNKIGKREKFRHFASIAIFLALIFYLVYHAINGERGLLAFINLSQQVGKLQKELDDVRTEKMHLEHRVNLMRSESLDADLLDEQARKILGYSGDKDAVYIMDNKSPKPIAK